MKYKKLSAKCKLGMSKGDYSTKKLDYKISKKGPKEITVNPKGKYHNILDMKNKKIK